MTRFHFVRPDVTPRSAQNILIHLNELVPPEGFSGVSAVAAGALVQTLTLDALVQTGTLTALVQTGTV